MTYEPNEARCLVTLTVHCRGSQSRCPVRPSARCLSHSRIRRCPVQRPHIMLEFPCHARASPSAHVDHTAVIPAHAAPPTSLPRPPPTLPPHPSAHRAPPTRGHVRTPSLDLTASSSSTAHRPRLSPLRQSCTSSPRLLRTASLKARRVTWVTKQDDSEDTRHPLVRSSTP